MSGALAVTTSSTGGQALAGSNSSTDLNSRGVFGSGQYGVYGTGLNNGANWTYGVGGAVTTGGNGVGVVGYSPTGDGYGVQSYASSSSNRGSLLALCTGSAGSGGVLQTGEAPARRPW